MENPDLEKIVSQPTWRAILLELVATEQLDPWNIDIVDITDKYIKKVKELQVLDLRIPANLILAAAILLRFKSEALKFEEEEQVVQDQTYIEEERAPVEIPILSLRTRIPPKRKVTLQELMQALEDVFMAQKRRELKKQHQVIFESISIELPKYDISKKMDEILHKAQNLADSEGFLTFSSLLSDTSPKEKIYTLLPILHLAQDDKIVISQEQWLGEILIYLVKLESELNGDTAKPANAS
ncbi:segregation/condensation protein A [Candidatus Micrarchaeota archaeon]|nr:segregation/condensation protein A [Candidatus Micrarchaeota archaeon]